MFLDVYSVLFLFYLTTCVCVCHQFHGPLRECNRAGFHKLSAIDVTQKTINERLILNSGPRRRMSSVIMPYFPRHTPLTLQLFLDSESYIMNMPRTFL